MTPNASHSALFPFEETTDHHQVQTNKIQNTENKENGNRTTFIRVHESKHDTLPVTLVAAVSR